MRAHGRKYDMGKRFAIVIGAAALGAAVIASGASADFTSVKDPRGYLRCVDWIPQPTKPCSDSTRHRRRQLLRAADIVRATAGHDGTRLKHTIRVVGKFRFVIFRINPPAGPGCVSGLSVRRGQRPTDIGFCRRVLDDARVDFHRHSVEISFSRSSIKGASYRWRAYTALGTQSSGVTVSDYVPNFFEEDIEHSLR
jgi:hypothetical protein